MDAATITALLARRRCHCYICCCYCCQCDRIHYVIIIFTVVYEDVIGVSTIGLWGEVSIHTCHWNSPGRRSRRLLNATTIVIVGTVVDESF